MTNTPTALAAAHAAATINHLEFGCLVGLALAAVFTVNDRSPATSYLSKALAASAAIGLCVVFVVRHLAGPDLG